MPKRILNCQSVIRQIEFASREMLQNLRLVQTALLNGVKIEEWTFKFGFVIPQSVNSWETEIVASEDMIPIEELK